MATSLANMPYFNQMVAAHAVIDGELRSGVKIYHSVHFFYSGKKYGTKLSLFFGGIVVRQNLMFQPLLF
jgi:hypothetical protein